MTAFFSSGLLVGTYFVLEDNDADCGGLRFNMYLIIALHFVNIIVSLLMLLKCEVKLCNSNMICGFFIFEFTMLTFMQVTYFGSQYNRCISASPDLYFWTMG